MGLLQVYGGMFQMAGTIVPRAVESSPSIAYEPPVWARRGTQHANESIRRPAIVGAIRFLVKPGRGPRVILRKAEVLLAAWEETSIIDTIFDDANLREFEFIGLLKSDLEGREVAWQRMTKIAAAAAPGLSIPRKSSWKSRASGVSLASARA